MTSAMFGRLTDCYTLNNHMNNIALKFKNFSLCKNCESATLLGTHLFADYLATNHFGNEWLDKPKLGKLAIVANFFFLIVNLLSEIAEKEKVN